MSSLAAATVCCISSLLSITAPSPFVCSTVHQSAQTKAHVRQASIQAQSQVHERQASSSQWDRCCHSVSFHILHNSTFSYPLLIFMYRIYKSISIIEQLFKIIWHKATLPQQTDSSIIFARLHQSASHEGTIRGHSGANVAHLVNTIELVLPWAHPSP